MALIEIRDLHKRFGKLAVFNGVSLSVPEGQSLVVLGPSGTGKSVLLKHLVGLLRPDSGEVLFDGKMVNGAKERDLTPIREQFGFLFQMGALFDSLTVEQNIAFPLQEHTSLSAEEISEVVGKKLQLVGLPETRARMPAELSGGQRKRVALARAIALDPRVILYDEPTTGLDPIRADVINELILKLKRELKVTGVIVTHDMHSAFRVADRMVMLNGGKIVFDGTAQEIRDSDDPFVRSFVRGEASPEELATLQLGLDSTPVAGR